MSTIQQDVLEQDTTPAPADTTPPQDESNPTATTTTEPQDNSDPQPSPRDLAMAALEAKRTEEFEREARGENTTARDEDDEDAPSDQLQRQLLADGLDRYQVRMKVNGEERVVGLDDVLRVAQKHESADQRLAEATRLLREAEARAAAAIEAAKNTPAPTGKPAAEPAPVEPSAVVKEAIDALLDGDTDSATQKLTAALGGIRPTQQPDVAAITASVKQQLTVDSALEQFGKDYRDVVGNPTLASIADGYLAQELNSGKHRAFGDALAAAGDLTREWVRNAAASVQTPGSAPTTTRQEKLERKQSATHLPTASAVAASTGTPQPENPADVISAMRKARGQLV